MESTIVDVSGAVPVVLRVGGVSEETLRAVAGHALARSGLQQAQGARHQYLVDAVVHLGKVRRPIRHRDPELRQLVGQTRLALRSAL